MRGKIGLLMIKAVVFDFDSTLADYFWTDKQAISKRHELANIVIPLNEFFEKSGDIVSELYQEDNDYGSSIHEARLKAT
jgi:hypothetical protein